MATSDAACASGDCAGDASLIAPEAGGDPRATLVGRALERRDHRDPGDRELVGADIARPPLWPPDAALIGGGTAAVSGGNRVDRRAARPGRHRGGGASVVLQPPELGVTAATGAGPVAVAQVAAAVRDCGAGAPGAVRAEARGDDRVLQPHVVAAQRGLDEQASAHACRAGGARGGPGSAAGPDPVAGHGRIAHLTGSRRDRDPTAAAAGATRTCEPAPGAAGARDVAVQGAVDHRKQPGSTEDASPRGAQAAAAVGTARSRAGTSQAADPAGSGAVAVDRRGGHRQRALIVEPPAAPARSSGSARARRSERVGVPRCLRRRPHRRDCPRPWNRPASAWPGCTRHRHCLRGRRLRRCSRRLRHSRPLRQPPPCSR